MKARHEFHEGTRIWDNLTAKNAEIVKISVTLDSNYEDQD